jgi:phage nucleotide-binding protein
MILDRIKSVKDIQTHMKVLVYGRSGTGKTTFASTFPGPILFLDIKENGTESVSDVEGAERLDIESVSDMNEIFDALLADPKLYKTVIIDSVTMLEKIVVAEVKAKTKKMTFKEWGEVSATLNEIIISFRDLPCHVVFLAQDKTKTEDAARAEDDLDPEVGASLMPSVVKLLNGAVSVIGHTFIRQKEVIINNESKTKMQYRLRIGPSPFYITKIRKPVGFIVPESIVNPTYEKILKIQKGE